MPKLLQKYHFDLYLTRKMARILLLCRILGAVKVEFLEISKNFYEFGFGSKEIVN